MIPVLLVMAPLLSWLATDGAMAAPARLAQWGGLALALYALAGYVRLRRRGLIAPEPGIRFLAGLACMQVFMAFFGVPALAWIVSGLALVMVRRLSAPVLTPLVHGRLWMGVSLVQAGGAGWNFVFPGP